MPPRDTDAFLVVTATDATTKTINQLLLYLRWWELGEGSTWDCIEIVRSETRITVEAVEHEPDVLPIQNFSDNKFRGWSIADVERLASISCKDGRMRRFLLLDDQGLRDETIILVERVFHHVRDESTDHGKLEYLDKYDKVRVPWESALSHLMNLNFGNVDFKDYCVEGDSHDGPKEAYWWTRKPFDRNVYNEVVRKRNAALIELEELGQS